MTQERGDCTEREISARYRDPLDEIWLTLASRLGLRVSRSDAVFASTNGAGDLSIGVQASLDRDDCLAQMIFHELCHALVQGPESWMREDWGLDVEGPQSLIQERACLRVQHHLAQRYGLCRVLAPTTEHRRFYDELGSNSFAEDESSTRAREGLQRANERPFFPWLDRTLERTHELASIVASQILDAGPASTTLLARVQSMPPPDFECKDCGACCRGAFDVVEVDTHDSFLIAEGHHELVTWVDGRATLPRPNQRCVALDGNAGSYSCRVYVGRPQTCRDFTRGSVNCREARKKLGVLS